MVIYLRHEKHGTKVATSLDEAKADEKNGWERMQVGALLTPEHRADEGLNALRAQYAEKFGKTPHHKKSAETLRAELAA